MIKSALKIPVLFWRRFISPWMPPACRFYPSCSAYALEALDRHSWPCALRLIVWRVLRCNPFSAGGYDPVPDRAAHGKSSLPEHETPHDPTRKAI